MGDEGPTAVCACVSLCVCGVVHAVHPGVLMFYSLHSGDARNVKEISKNKKIQPYLITTNTNKKSKSQYWKLITTNTNKKSKSQYWKGSLIYLSNHMNHREFRRFGVDFRCMRLRNDGTNAVFIPCIRHMMVQLLFQR